MQAVEDRFEHIVKRQRKDVNVVRETVRENGRVQREMKVGISRVSLVIASLILT
jgi:hypothetical protein